MTKVFDDDHEESDNNTSDDKFDIGDDMFGHAQLSATILDNSGGVCNSFDTTVACDETIAHVDDDEDIEDETDSGVHNTPDNLNDDIDTSFDILTHDSLYESLKYQQGKYNFLQ